MLNPPTYSKAIVLGFSNLGDTEPYAEDIPFTVWAANIALGREKPRRADGIRTQLQARRALALRSGQQGAGHRHPGEICQAGPKDVEDAYDYQVAKLKLFGLDGDVSDKTYEKMAEGLVEISFIKKPYPPKSAIFDGSFVQWAA